jgi:hypothetical protein
MKVKYSRSVDAATIVLGSTIASGSVVFTYPCYIAKLDGAMINLDFDSSGQLVQIEVVGASNHLSKELLEKAEIIG